jgi:cellobiose dehydrogenase (acceptor)
MLCRDGNREIPEWSLDTYPGNELTRHDNMVYYLTNYPGSPNASSYYCTNLPDNQLAACLLGGGTSINAEQQWWPTEISR